MQGAQSASGSANNSTEPAALTQQPPSTSSTSISHQPLTANTNSHSAQNGTTTAQSATQAHSALNSAASAPHPLSKTPLFLSSQQQQASSTSAAPSPAATTGDVDMDEVDQLDDDGNSQEVVTDPRKMKDKVPTKVASTSTSTSSNAAAGPGPSSAANAAAREATPVKKQKNGGIFPASGSSGGTPSSSSVAAKKSVSKAQKTPRLSLSDKNRYTPLPLPHYTVRRAAGTKGNPHVLVINDDCTDASADKWPEEKWFEEGYKDPGTGRLSWYERQGKKGTKHLNFRQTVGNFVAKELGLATGGNNDEWILESLPQGYLYTVHHTVTNAGLRRDNDVYIYGSVLTQKFRTANEFGPHLYWLLVHGPDDNLTCQCKYCSKKTQGDVNRITGLTDGRASSVLSQASTSAGAAASTPRTAKTKVEKKDKEREKDKKAKKDKDDKASSSAEAGFLDPGGHKLLGSEKQRRKEEKKRRRALEEQNGTGTKAKKPRSGSASASRTASASASPEPHPAYTGPFVNRQRDGDLTDLFSHRIQDLVWAELPEPLLPTAECIEQAGTAAEAARAYAEEVAKQAQAGAGGGGGGGGEEEVAGAKKVAEAMEKQFRDVKVARITHWPGIVFERVPVLKSQVKVKTDRQPRFKEEGEKELAAEGEGMFSFVDGKGQQEFRYKVNLLALADTLDSLTGAQIRTWLAHPPPTTLWEGSMMIDPKAAGHVWDEKARKTRRDCKLSDFGGRLEEAVTAMALGMQIAAHVVGTYAVADRMRIEADMLQVDLAAGTAAELKNRVDRQTNSWSYQCLYWGAERLWIGDMVRLMFNGLPAFVAPPSPPAEQNGNEGGEATSAPPPPLAPPAVPTPAPTPQLAVQPSPGTAMRSLFMRIDNIYKDSESSRTKVAGQIYELRDLEDDPPLTMNGEVNGNGNGATTTGAMSMFEKKAPRDSRASSSSSSATAVNDQNGKNAEDDPLYRLPDSAYTASFSLPTPPPLYEWRLLSNPSRSTSCDVEHLGGRYHPIPPGSVLEDRGRIDQVLESEALSGPQQLVQELHGEGGGGKGASLGWEERAVVLAGLRPAFRLFMKCGEAVTTRHQQIIGAEKKASQEVGMYFARLEEETTTGTPQPQQQE